METTASQIARQLAKTKVLVVDDEAAMRKVTRALLTSIGVKNIREAPDGASGLEAICTFLPDIVILDWEMPVLNGGDFMRIVRSPENFPRPDVAVVMLTGHNERSCVLEAVRLGVNEFLLKPVSSSALLARLVSILCVPRKMVRRGEYYGPEPRRASTYKPDVDAGFEHVFFVN